MQDHKVQRFSRVEIAQARLQYYGRAAVEAAWEQMVRNGFAAELEARDARRAARRRRNESQDRYRRRRFDESKHPRAPAGRPEGGQFIDAHGGMSPGTGESARVGGNRVPLSGQNDLQQSPPSVAFPGYVVTPGRAPTSISSFLDRRQPSVGRDEQTLLASATFANPILLATLFGATPDYREIFKESLKGAAKAWFPSDWEVHHRYQQAAEVPELQTFFKNHMPEHDLHSLDNLVGVPNPVHGEINNIQAQFWEEELDKIRETKEVVVDDSDRRSKIRAVLRNTNDGNGSKALFKRYKVLVDYIDAEYDSYFAKPEAKLTRFQSISTNLESFVDPKQVAKRMIAHAKATNPDLYTKLQKRGGINQLLNDLIAIEKQGKTSRKFSKLLRYAGIGSLLLMAGSVAQGATSNQADVALEGFIRKYEIVSIGQLERRYAHENELQLVAVAFHDYLKELNISEDNEALIMKLLYEKIGLNHDAGQ